MTKILVDLHIHDRHSSDCRVKPAKIFAKAKKVGLSYIAITNHDSVKKLAQKIKLAQKYQLTLIPGIEITTKASKRKGVLKKHFPHVLVLSHRIESILEIKNNYSFPRRLFKLDELMQYLAQLKDIFIIAPHPKPKGGMFDLTFDEVKKYAHIFQVIETGNGREHKKSGLFRKKKYKIFQQKRHELAQQLNLPIINSSDAHRSSRVGLSYTEIDGDIKSVSELFKAIEAKKTKPVIITSK